MFFKVHRFACMPRAEVYWFPRGASSALSQRGMEIRSGSRRLEVYASRVRCLQWRRRPGGRLCSPSSMIWYLARAFMLKAPYCWQRHRVQWTRRYCRAVLRWATDCIEPRYKSSALPFLTRLDMGARGRLAPPAHGCQLRLRRRHEVYITLSVRYIMPECRGVFINHLTLQSCWTRRLQRFREVKIMTLRSHIIRPPRLHGLTESERQLVAWIVHSDQPQIDLLSILSVSCGVCHAPAQWLMYSTSTYYIILCRTQNDVFCRLGVLGLQRLVAVQYTACLSK